MGHRDAGFGNLWYSRGDIMDLRQFNLNLLLVLDALLKERSVTGAASRLGMSQPTVSSALKRLRTVFQDELFVKQGKGVKPTSLAAELEQPLGEILRQIQSQLLQRSVFDPATTERTFTIIGGELGQMLVTHRVLMKLLKLAPRAQFRFIFPPAHECVKVLEEGRADLTIGYFPQFAQSSLFQQRLFSRPLVCVARSDHPVLTREGLTLETFTQLSYAVVATLSNLEGLIEPELRRLGLRRQVKVEMGHASGTPLLLRESDLITLVPDVLAHIYCLDGSLSSWPLPFQMRECEVRQFWHRAVHDDPAVTWLRSVVAQEFQHIPGGGEFPRSPLGVIQPQVV